MIKRIYIRFMCGSNGQRNNHITHVLTTGPHAESISYLGLSPLAAVSDFPLPSFPTAEAYDENREVPVYHSR